jgi:hypothetical protein
MHDCRNLEERPNRDSIFYSVHDGTLITTASAPIGKNQSPVNEGKPN